MKSLPISARLLLSYLLVAVLPLSGLALLHLSEFENSLRATALENMSTIADKKADEIDSYIFERLSDAKRLSQKLSIAQGLNELGQAFRHGGLETAAYRALERQFRDNLKRHYPEVYDSYDFLLIDTAGNVVFSLAREADLGTNLHTGPYRATQLAQGFDLVSQTMQARLTRFSRYAPSNERAAAFLIAPMLEGGAITGVLALQIDVRKLESVVSDRTGLGSSGETVLAQRDGEEAYYTVPLRHIPDAAFRYRVPLPDAALPMQQALAGAHERGTIRDYAGVDCIAAWRYLPALRWGMVVKMDTEEAMAPAAKLRRLTYLALALFLLLSGAAAYFLGRRLSRPIRDLTRVAGLIAEGDLTQRAPQGGGDELGRLADTFNQMTDALADARLNLEAKVEKRTQELLTSKSRLIEAQHTARIGNWELDLVSGELHWSDEIFNIFEIDQEKFGASYEAFLEAIHPEDRDQVNQAYTDSLATRTPYEITHRLRMPDGRIKWVEERCQTLYDEQCKPLRSTGTVQDISELKKTEIALIKSKDAAEAANRAKSAFLANMSHEIRTPMNAILGLTQLVLDSGLKPRQENYLRKVHASSKALLGILNDILDYSKIEADRMEIERVPLRVENILRDAADLFSARIEEKKLELFFDIAPEVPIEVLGDPLRLSQVLNNLLGNAVKFTERGEIGIKVEATRTAADALTLRFAVRDTGIGLSREQSARLFQPFTQADGSITRKYGGTGLGLAICQKLVGLMGGEIMASGAEGQGTTFSFTIQVGLAQNAAAALDLQRLSGLKVLVVDDQETSRLILGQLLETWGLKAQSASSGEQALTCIAEAERSGQPFDAVLLDWRMPGMSGLDVAQRLEQDSAQGRITHPLLVVMVTIHSKDEVLAQAGSIRLNSVLTKPVVPSYLFDALVSGRQPAPLPATGAAAYSSTMRFDGARILLAEDHFINQEVAAAFLQRLGITVSLANNGSEAVEWVQRQAFDAVLMDLHMPVMDGFEATRQIRELPQGKDLPIIAMTAAVMQEDRERCSAAGMVDFVAKPIDPDELTRVLQKWLKFQSSPALDNAETTMLPDQLPGFDLAQALRRLGSDHDLLARLLCNFAEEQATLPAQLDGLLQTGETTQAITLLHTFKGIAANLGAIALAQEAQQLEQEIRDGKEPHSHPAFASSLEAAIDAITTYLQACETRKARPPKVDMHALVDVLGNLVPYLQERELIPDDLAQTLHQMARSVTSKIPLARLAHQIDQFDYDGALVTIEQVNAALEPTSRTDP